MRNQSDDTINIADSEIPHELFIGHSQVHLKSVVLALIVTVLWSSSWVIIKFGLEEIPALTFAGLRYTIASLVLLSLTLSKNENLEILRKQTKKWWAWILAYGLIYITMTQGTQFVALDLMPATTISLMLNLTPIIVLFFSAMTLNETVSRQQALYIGLVLVGLVFYFYPVDFLAGEIIGFIVILLSLFANAASSLLGRAINRTKTAPALVVTSISMSIGAVILLGFGFLIEERSPLSSISIFLILWLALFNTALAFTMWNHAMQTLRAIDTALINCLMLPQIIFLSIVFLGEMPSLLDWIGIGFVAIGVFMVQLNQAKQKSKENK
jgi:drug/metabolite transporter (DMT)-like permease